MGAIRKFTKPRKINPHLTMMLNETVLPQLPEYARQVAKNVRIYCTNTRRGMSYGFMKTITVPSWVFGTGNVRFGPHELVTTCEEIRLYYIAHELAHQASPGDHHGMKFMEEFKKICPEHLQYIEYGYKPRNAGRAGVAGPKA